jgi:hypothetical protein
MQTADLMLITVKEVIEWLISQGQEVERDRICNWYIVPTKQILAYMIEQGCSPACDIWQLLAFSTAKFDVNQESSVNVLGYDNTTKDGFHPCPSLHTYNGKRGLDLDWYNDDRCWREDDCFLAVRKAA